MSKRRKKNPKNHNSRFPNKTTIKLHQLDWLEYVAIGLSAWFVIYPHPYFLLFTLLLLLPIIGILLNGIHKPSIASLVEIDLKKNEYDVADFIDFPAFAIIIRLMIDYSSINFFGLFFPSLLAFIGILILLFFTHKKIEQSRKSKFWIYLSISFCLFVYSFAFVHGTNCVYDFSESKIIQVKVLDKFTKKRRKSGYDYYLKLEPWGNRKFQNTISVTSKEYDNYVIGGRVEVHLKKGLYNIPWYYLE